MTCQTTIYKADVETDSCASTDAFVSIKLKIHCPTKSYSKSDGCMVLDMDGADASTFARSLTDKPNFHRPIDGIQKNPPTWEIKTLCELIFG